MINMTLLRKHAVAADLQQDLVFPLLYCHTFYQWCDTFSSSLQNVTTVLWNSALD